jgi:hypothetical protein
LVLQLRFCFAGFWCFGFESQKPVWSCLLGFTSEGHRFGAANIVWSWVRCFGGLVLFLLLLGCCCKFGLVVGSAGWVGFGFGKLQLSLMETFFFI